jgi:hypothetical protein
VLSSRRTYSAVAGSCTWATVRSLATPVAAKKAPTVACRPLVHRLGLVLPSLNRPTPGDRGTPPLRVIGQRQQVAPAECGVRPPQRLGHRAGHRYDKRGGHDGRVLGNARATAIATNAPPVLRARPSGFPCATPPTVPLSRRECIPAAAITDVSRLAAASPPTAEGFAHLRKDHAVRCDRQAEARVA